MCVCVQFVYVFFLNFLVVKARVPLDAGMVELQNRVFLLPVKLGIHTGKVAITVYPKRR